MPPPSSVHGVTKKRRNKSFAGCWTCRARKIKCDERRPVCVQCESKQLLCEGYEVRLRWMPLEAGSSGSDASGRNLLPDLLEEPSAAAPPRSQRSLIAFDEPTTSPLQLSDLDQIFSLIDGFQSTKDDTFHDQDHHLVLANFGVFDTFNVDCAGWNNSPEPTIGSADDTPISASATAAAESWLPSSGIDFGQSTESLSSGASPDDFDPILQNTASTFGEADAGSVGSSSSALIPDAGCSSSRLHEQSNHHTSNTSVLLRTDDNPEVDHPSFWWKADSGAIVHNPSPYIMPELERFLMNHYVHRVVQLFCVIDYDKSPWKTIHLPRVLQSTGDLSLHGSTSSIRHALRNALLSISAFYMSNDSRSRFSEDEADQWANHAIKYRGRAIKLLKETVESSTPESPPKYKELLATMLSMITINVMSGDTGTCGIHLDGAFRFMNHARQSKSKYSSKAQSLHRIYLYLRVIYDSTAYRNSDDEFGTIGSGDTDPGASLSVALLDKVEDSSSTSVLTHVTSPRTQLGSYECVYGVPQSLLILLARATDIIEQIASLGCDIENARGDLAEQCDALESEILDWSPDGRHGAGSRRRANDPETNETPSAEIIRKTTVAFHNALIIYFAQHVRLMRHSYLRVNIQNVIQNIDDIETIKSDSGIVAAPLYWPAFIAGSEAFDQRLQERFRAWYERVEPYRFASVRTGISVLTEVWKEGPNQQNRTTSQWRAVVQRTGARLMLS